MAYAEPCRLKKLFHFEFRKKNYDQSIIIIIKYFIHFNLK